MPVTTKWAGFPTRPVSKPSPFARACPAASTVQITGLPGMAQPPIYAYRFILVVLLKKDTSGNSEWLSKIVHNAVCECIEL